MILSRVIEICVARGGKCNDCIYNGKTCEHAKAILKVDKPLKYNYYNQSRKENLQ